MDRRHDQVKGGIKAVALGLAVVVLLGFCAATAAPVVRHGVISKDETWQGEIHVIGDIVVPEGVTLTILPGTIVRITANQDAENLSPPEPFWMQAGTNWGPDDYENAVFHGEPYRDEGRHISIRIFGTLLAVGTPAEMILITSDSSSPTVWDWNLLVFRHGVLAYATVEYYRGLNGAKISHCVLRHVGECAVCSNSGTVEYSTISYAGHELVDAPDSSLIIQSNHLGPTAGNGITAGGGSPQIIDNTFDECGTGIAFIKPRGPELVMRGNVFLNCRSDIKDSY